MKAIDPVSRMEDGTATAQWKTQDQGKNYYFCGPGCKRSFEQDPEDFSHGGPPVPKGYAAGEH